MYSQYPTLDIFVKVSQILGFLSLAVTMYFGIFRYKQYYLTSQRQHIDTVFRCNSRYEKLVIEFLRISKNAKEQEWELTSNLAIAKLLVELFDEQLFYISQGIVPQKIALNWISKMTDFFDNEQMCLTKLESLSSTQDEILKNTCMFRHYMFTSRNLFGSPEEIYTKLIAAPVTAPGRSQALSPVSTEEQEPIPAPTGFRHS